MSKNVKAILIAIAVLGILSELSVFLEFHPSLQIVRAVFSTVWLYFPALRYFHNDTGSALNYLHLIAYFLLLVGMIAYSVSDGREMRLIRFIVSIILISNVVTCVIQISLPFLNQGFNQMAPGLWWLFAVVTLIKGGLLIYFSWKVLITLRNTRTIEKVVEEGIIAVVQVPVEASRWERLTNALLDSFVCLFVLLPLFQLFPFLETIAESAGERTSIYVFLIIARVIYYLFFEILLHATPAKYLTETRVTDVIGNEPEIDSIFARTLGRCIPFEGFSFLGKQGLHDSVSSTRVVNEVRTGVKGSRYFLVLPAIAGAALISWLVVIAVNDYKIYQHEKNEYEVRMSVMHEDLKNITTSHVIQLRNVDNGNNETYLKIEELNDDEIIVGVITVEDNNHTVIEIERLYHDGKYFKDLPVKLSVLKETLIPKYDDYLEERNNAGRALLFDDKKFVVSGIKELFAPNLQSNGSVYKDNESIRIGFNNDGYPARVIAFEKLEGEIEFPPSQLPIEIPAVASQWGDASFKLHGEKYKGGVYKIRMTIEYDDRNYESKQQAYIIEGEGMDYKIRKIKRTSGTDK